MTLKDHADIVKFIEGHENEAKAIREEALRLCWWMRGSISYDEAMQLSRQDREIINSIIKDNLEASKKSNIPIF